MRISRDADELWLFTDFVNDKAKDVRGDIREFENVLDDDEIR